MRCFLLALSLCVVSCGDDAVSPLMWRVEAQGASAPSYLLGTIHIGVSARDELPSSVWDAFARSSSLVEEAEIRFIDQQEYLQLAALPGSDTLDALLPAPIWTQLVALLSNVPQARLRSLRPWAVSSALYNTLVPAVEGMDLTLLNEADNTQKSLVLLEPWQDQVKALNQVALKDDLAGLEDLVANHALYRDRLADLMDRYRAGDADEVWRLAPDAGAVAPTGTPAFDTFIRKRTQAWLPTVQQQIDGGGAFIAVGFGHVLGSDGLVQVLQSKGYTVTRVE